MPNYVDVEYEIEWTNDTSGATNWVKLYGQLENTNVTGSEMSQTITTAGVYQTKTSGKLKLSTTRIPESYMLRAWCSTGTATIRSYKLRMLATS